MKHNAACFFLQLHSYTLGRLIDSVNLWQAKKVRNEIQMSNVTRLWKSSLPITLLSMILKFASELLTGNMEPLEYIFLIHSPVVSRHCYLVSNTKTTNYLLSGNKQDRVDVEFVASKLGLTLAELLTTEYRSRCDKGRKPHIVQGSVISKTLVLFGIERLVCLKDEYHLLDFAIGLLSWMMEVKDQNSSAKSQRQLHI